MAKNNKGGKNRSRNNYFTQNIQKSGENFLAAKTPRDLANDADRIFRDFARGNVDIQQYAEYIMNPSFLEVMITRAAEKYNYWWAIKIAIDSYTFNYLNNNMQVDESTKIVFGGTANDVLAKYTVYEQLYNCLRIVRETGNPMPLENLPRVVGNYKFSI